MDAPTKNEIIAEITATAVKTTGQTLPEDFVAKTTDEAVKRIKSSTVPEFKNKGNKMLAEGKKIILKQQKLLRIGDREEDGWEVIKYLSDDLASDSEDEKLLPRARREAAANKKKREANRQKDKKKQFRNASPLRKNFEIFNKPHQRYSGIRNNAKSQKVCFACGQEGHFQYFCPNRRKQQGLGNFSTREV